MVSLASFSKLPKLKLILLALLTLNVGLYAFIQNVISTLEDLVWLMLLMMYELEAFPALSAAPKPVRRIIRDVLIAAIVLIFLEYLRETAWLDITNNLLWFLLIGLMELELRLPQTLQAYHKLYWAAMWLTFAGLLLLAMLWLLRGAWLDAYDALLWIAAFGFIEVDILRFFSLRTVDRKDTTTD
jgi:hypothetical protein